MSIQIDSHDLEKLDADLAQAVRKAPESKKEVLNSLGQQLLSQVQGNIGGSGKVQRWQHMHLGSGGGYVAVHPAEKTSDVYGRAVGAVTNAIESGHKIRPPSGKAKRYTPRIKKARVPAKGMYAKVLPERAAEQAAAQLGQRLAHDLGGS
ncbi:hypothetical protein [Flintibacter sp. KGMB00164]|uniref:hypothetical protein n=1 Tax=Flintibacter sp. KGMB00164 TaxID=2610895 RepID=UPI0012478298|nr:hypothetical protein [Flintibacter sp. KGMB00164]